MIGRKAVGQRLARYATDLAILLFALIGIGRLMILGTDLALDVQGQSEAALKCQSKLNEVLAGAVPLGGQTDTPFDEDPDYRWSLDVQSGQAQGLYNVTVRVSSRQPDGPEWSISRMMLDPSIVGSTQDSVPVQRSATTGGSGSSGASSGGGGPRCARPGPTTPSRATPGR